MQEVRGSNPLSSTEFFERLSSPEVTDQVTIAPRLAPSVAEGGYSVYTSLMRQAKPFTSRTLIAIAGFPE